MGSNSKKRLALGVAAGLMAGSAFAQGEMEQQMQQPPSMQQPPQQRQMPTEPQARMQMQTQMEPFESQASPKVIEQVRNVARQYQQAWNSHDADAMAKLYTKDATYMNASGQTASGMNAIRDLVKQEQQGPAKNSQVMINVESVRTLTPNLVVVDSEVMTQGGSPQLARQVHSTAIVMKQGNQRKIQALRSYPSPHQMQQGVGGAGQQGVPINEPEPRPYQQFPGEMDGGTMQQPMIE